MKRTPAQAGPFAAWLKRKRTERYARQSDALADLRRLAGIAISASEFAQWESGSRIPREDNPKRLRLIEFFGGSPDEAQTESPATSDGAGLSELAGMMVAQAEAFTRLLDVASRRDVDIEARLRAMEAEVRSLRERLGVPVPGELSAPRGTAG